MFDLRAALDVGECLPKRLDKASSVDSSFTDPLEAITVFDSSKVGGRRLSSSLGHGVVGLESSSLRPVLGFVAIGSGLSIGPDAKSTDLQISAPMSSDPGRPEVVDRPMLGGYGWRRLGCLPPVVGLSAGKDVGIEGIQGNHRFFPLWFVNYSGYLFPRCVLSKFDLWSGGI